MVMITKITISISPICKTVFLKPPQGAAVSEGKIWWKDAINDNCDKYIINDKCAKYIIFLVEIGVFIALKFYVFESDFC